MNLKPISQRQTGRVILLHPVSETEKQLNSSIVMSEKTIEDLNNKRIREQNRFFEVVGVSADLEEFKEINIGDFVHVNWPPPQFDRSTPAKPREIPYIAETHFCDGVRYIVIPAVFISVKQADPVSYKVLSQTTVVGEA